MSDTRSSALTEDAIEAYEASSQQLAAWSRTRQTGPSEAEAVLTVHGPGCASRLGEIWDEWLGRHEVLRTQLTVPPGMTLPLAVIGAASQIRPVLSTDGPDTATVRLEAPTYSLDAGSADALARDLAECLARPRPDWPDPLQYADYAAWHAETVEAPDAVRGFDFWRRPEAMPGRPAPLPQRQRGDEPGPIRNVGVALDDDRARSLLALADERGVSITATLVGAFAGLLHRIVGEAVTVGTLFDGRGFPELEGAVGPYARYIPVRLDPTSASSWIEFVGQTHERLVEYGRWQDYFSWRELLGSVLDDTADAYFLYSVDVADLSAPRGDGQDQVTVAHRRTALDRIELQLTATRYPDRMELSLEYDDARYAETDAAYLAQQLAALLEHAAEEPGSPTAALRIMSMRQAHQIQFEFNDTATPIDPRTLHELCEAAARQWPTEPALISGAESISRADLDARANQTARLLIDHGVRRSDLVAVCLPRGIDAVIAHLAVLKAGAAYVPLEPGYPDARLYELLEAVQPAAIIAAAGRFPERVTICPDRDRERLDAQPATKPSVEVEGDDLAYVIFTSGSTGTPKGVMIDHRGAVNTILDVTEHFDVGPGDTVLCVSSFTFDLAVYDVFGGLAAGCRIVLVEEGQARDPRRWTELVERQGVTVWDSVPALFSAMLDHVERGSAQAPATLRAVMLSGDRIPVGLPDRARRLVPGLRVESMGGATEASIWSIRYPIAEVDPAWTSIPYGRPMPNQSFVVLDAAGALCPVWVTGELAIGGVGLARGYLGQPGTTAERFVANAYAASPGQRLYRTGDLGRFRPDGTIEFLGRVDDQVKMRGFRLEPSEVTATLLRHEGVREAVTVVHHDDRTGPRLLSFVAAEADVTERDLRAFLAERLPRQARPSSISILSALPLTDNGKVAVAKLRAPAASAYVAPRNSAEADLAIVWADLLGVERVGILDDFFELGGHSLLLSQLATRIAEQFGTEIELQELFEAGTVEAMADRVIRAQLHALDEQEAADLLADVRGLSADGAAIRKGDDGAGSAS